MPSNCPNFKIAPKLIAGQKGLDEDGRQEGLINKLLYDLFMKNICCRKFVFKIFVVYAE